MGEPPRLLTTYVMNLGTWAAGIKSGATPVTDQSLVPGQIVADELTLRFGWATLLLVAMALMFALAALYNIVTGTSPSAMVYLVGFPAFFACAGMVLHFGRAFVDGIVLLSRRKRAGYEDQAVTDSLSPLLRTSDFDFVLQCIAAVAVELLLLRG